MRAVILTCTMGQGHNSAAKAVCEAMISGGAECEIVDAMSFGGKKTSEIVSSIYKNTIVKMPKLFGYVYKAGKAVSSFNFKSPVYFANSLYVDSLYDYLSKNKFDAAVCSHLFPMEALTYLKSKKDINIKTYGILTDYTSIPFIEETDMDAYFVPDIVLDEEFSEKKIDKSKLIVTGIPVSHKFTKKLSKAAARENLGLHFSSKIFLIMTGGEGCGNITELCSNILKKDDGSFLIIVLTGRNETLKEKLELLSDEKIVPVTFTDKVELYMDACDVLLTKPGGLSSTEAAVKNVPIIHISPIPGCETKNAFYFSNNGMSVVAQNYKEAAEKAVTLASDGLLCDEMIKAQKSKINPNASEDISEYVISNFRR